MKDRGRKGSIGRSYGKIRPFFRWFGKMFESKARVRALRMSNMRNGDSVLIIAPPEEFFIGKILKSNPNGHNRLLCFTDEMRKRVEGRTYRHTKTVNVGTPSGFPYGNDTFDVIFAFCLLDFLDRREGQAAVREMERVLKPGGRLLTTYLADPRGLPERTVVCLLTMLGRATDLGLRVVSSRPLLESNGFVDVKVCRCSQNGLPVGLACAEKAR